MAALNGKCRRRVARPPRMTPVGWRGRPAEFVGPAIFLVSDAASLVNGVVLPVDGGYCAL